MVTTLGRLRAHALGAAATAAVLIASAAALPVARNSWLARDVFGDATTEGHDVTGREFAQALRGGRSRMVA